MPRDEGDRPVDPAVRAALEAALAPVRAVADRPIAEHPAVYAEAHRALVDVLQAGAPGAGPR